MAIMKGSNRFEYDAAAALRPYDLPAAVASGVTGDFDLHVSKAYWGGYAEEFTVNLVVDVRALDTANTDETYKFAVEIGADDAYAVSKKEFAFDVTAPGVYTLELHVDTLRQMVRGAERFRVVYTLGGTSPAIDFAVYYAPGC